MSFVESRSFTNDQAKESTGALLITGKWECGKTHLITNLAKELDANKYLVVVSLFGVKSVELIPNIIKQKIIFSPFELSDKQMSHKQRNFCQEKGRERNVLCLFC